MPKRLNQPRWIRKPFSTKYPYLLYFIKEFFKQVSFYFCPLTTIINRSNQIRLKLQSSLNNNQFKMLKQNSHEEEIYHQIWLKCMQMNQCTFQQANQFVSKCQNYIDCTLTQTGQTLLMIACSIGSLPIVNACLHYGAKVHTKDTAGRTSLHYCAAIGSIEIFEQLISREGNAYEKTIGGETPLAKACMFCQGDIIEWYLNNALNAFEIQDNCGKKPLEILRLSDQELYQEVKGVYKQLTQG